MGTLTNQIISQTYSGLLNLEDSSTGVTSTPQFVQDGSGDNTGLKLSSSGFFANNLPYFRTGKGKYYGTGLSPTNNSFGSTGFRTNIQALAFPDIGLYSYSAMSLYVSVASATETIEFGFYNTQTSSVGLIPYQAILTGLTPNITTIGIKTIIFPQNISFSGSPGINFLVYKVTAPTTSPACRFYVGVRFPGVQYAELVNDYEVGLDPIYNYPRLYITSYTNVYETSFTSFEETFDSSTFASSINYDVSPNAMGFILHTI